MVQVHPGRTSMWLKAMERWKPSLALATAIFLPVPTGEGPLHVGQLLAIPLLPMLWKALVRARRLQVLIVACGVALLSAPVLLALSLSDPARGWNLKLASIAMATLICAALTAVLGFWSASVLGIRRFAILVAASATGVAVLNTGAWHDNPWKYAFAWPVSLLLVAVSCAWRKPLAMVVPALLSTVAFAAHSRNNGLALLVAAVAPLLSRLRLTPDRSRRYFRISVLVPTVLLVTLAATLALAHTRVTEREVYHTYLLDSRYESSAAIALFKYRPLGFGPGIVPSSKDVQVGESAITAAGFSRDNSYVRDNMFGGHLDLHSVTSNLWIAYGLAGLAVAVILGWILIGGLIDALNFRVAELSLVFFTGFQALWDLLFSPASALFWSGIAVAIALAPRYASKIASRIEP